LLRLVMADETIVVTDFSRTVQNLEDVFVNLVSGGAKYE
jgi:hypothetical protein